ncbi:hypothetical protein pb186bvf_003175 [Paramecium bursaria]
MHIWFMFGTLNHEKRKRLKEKKRKREKEKKRKREKEKKRKREKEKKRKREKENREKIYKFLVYGLATNIKSQLYILFIDLIYNFKIDSQGSIYYQLS